MPYDPPDDLIDLKARWYAARALAEQIAAEEPDPLPEDEAARTARTVTIKPQTAAETERQIIVFSDEQNARLNAARAEANRLALELHRHPWKRAQGDVHAAEKALNEAARERFLATTERGD
jgi:hypothetical protein